MTKEEILERGYVDVKVFVSGLRQSHRLQVVWEDMPQGKVPFLVARYYIPSAEMLKLAEQLQLPVKHKDTVVFPRGKMARDFAEEKDVSIEADTIEAEIED